jgi:hypothetical protein
MVIHSGSGGPAAGACHPLTLLFSRRVDLELWPQWQHLRVHQPDHLRAPQACASCPPPLAPCCPLAAAPSLRGRLRLQVMVRHADTLNETRRDWRLVTGQNPCPTIVISGL